MNLQSFAAEKDVLDFIDWFSRTHESLAINFQVAKSKFVPGGIKEHVVGFSNVLNHYRWLSADMQNGDWIETREKLSKFRAQLQVSISAGDQKKAFEVCEEILKWGGNRNKKRGAYPFLLGKFDNGTLIEYLKNCTELFNLDQATLANLTGIEMMNAMLTKVHAINSDDGLPIYDSRVSAATASLVEMWRRSSGLEASPLPAALSFPPTTSTRNVSVAYPNVKRQPELIYYGNDNTAFEWASAKVRLGWLIQLTLEANPNLFKSESQSSRMHAFEACLFMIGYNVGCLTGYPSSAKEPKLKSGRLVFDEKAVRKIVKTLSGTGTSIEYQGDIENGIRGLWGTLRFQLEPELFQELMLNFDGERPFMLGAEQSGKGREGSLGIWLKETFNMRARMASCIGPILVNEQQATKVSKSGKGIYLRLL